MRNLLKVSLLLLFPVLISGQTRTITDASIPVGSNVTFYSDTTYILSGMVFVDSAATLTIQAGTLIKAEDGQDTEASGLVVTRHAKIFAEGKADNPIIFTSINDDGSLDYTDRGEWGGVVLLGLAPTNNSTQLAVEGVNEIDPVRALYGGDDPNHSSGVFKYVSIRYSGINVGSSTGNEIQGLTLGAVGAGTVVEYVESYASGDDGFEFFGGTVNTNHLVSAFCSDDAFDTDQGFNGKNQFWFALQSPDKGGRLAEMDGAGGNEQGTPFGTPSFANVTYIGAGIGATPEGDGEQALIFRDNAGGYFYNSIVTEYDDASTSLGITVEDIDNTGDKVEDSMKRLEAGQLICANNIWYDFGAGNTVAEFAPQTAVAEMLNANNNMAVDPMLRGISRTTDGGLDPRPKSGSPALNNANVKILGDGFVQTNYVGAFGTENWLKGWTALDQLGYVGDLSSAVKTDVTIPEELALEQNYPNPFNPSTSIAFTLKEAGQVKLTIYNAVGQTVATLVNGYREAGAHKVVWHAENVSTGVFFYRLETAGHVMTKKMVYMR